jgi:hypothetical protein
MTPHALSLEPVLMLSVLIVLVVVIPLVGFAAWKFRVAVRVSCTVLAVAACSIYFLWLGEAIGRSKAWYHWRSEYQDPLVQIRDYVAEAYTNGNTQSIDRICREFVKQDVWKYGREPLFSKGSFRSFVEALGQTNVQSGFGTNALSK